MFNLWFTVNRMRSIARIVAYIQIELEERLYQPWLGWETSLRHYRRWVKRNRDTQQQMVESKIDRDAVPDAIGYYPTIYIMHVGIVALLLVGSLLLGLSNPGAKTIALFAITLAGSVGFTVSAIKWRPMRCKNMIEEDRIRWELVFEQLVSEGIKRKANVDRSPAIAPDAATTRLTQEPVPAG